MGIIRKATSLSTLGLVDFRSDKERTARSTRQTAKQAKEQTKLLQSQLEIQQRAAQQAQAQAAQQMLVQQQVAAQARAAASTAEMQRQALTAQAHAASNIAATAALAAGAGNEMNPPAATHADRIRQLDSLLAQGLISEAEHAGRKKEILDSI